MTETRKPVATATHLFVPMRGAANRLFPKCRVCWRRQDDPCHAKEKAA